MEQNFSMILLLTLAIPVLFFKNLGNSLQFSGDQPPLGFLLKEGPISARLASSAKSGSSFTLVKDLG